VTGAPKIRAMEIIREIEPRGIYCGCIGWFSPNRQCRLSVAIRTAIVFEDGRGEIGIGSGIVADSNAEDEYAEALLKMRFFAEAGYQT